MTVVFFLKVYDNTNGNILNYSDKGSINYNIKLKENEYYHEDIQKSNMAYVSSLIDYVDINFDYNLHFDSEIEYSYNYVVNANLYIINKNAKEDEDKVLFENKEELISSELKTGNSSDVKVSENLSIPYDKYNLIAGDFARQHQITPECYVDINFTVITDGKTEDISGINKSASMKLKIPLHEKLIDIDEKDATTENNGQFLSTGINKFWLMIAISMGIISIMFLIISIKLIIGCIPKLTPYDKRLKNIFKKYDQLIVKSKGKINLNKYTIEVKSFEDLVNVSDRVQQPIKFYEIVENEESVFVVDNLQHEFYIYYVKL